MDKKKDILKELQEIAPKLKNLPKEDGYKLPVNYFEQMQENVLQHTKQNEAPVQSKSILDRILKRIFKPQMALASMTLVLALSVGYFMVQKNDLTEDCLQISCLTNSEIDAYLSENLSIFDDTEFISDIDLDHESEAWNFDDDVLEDYLLENSEDLDLENLLL